MSKSRVAQEPGVLQWLCDNVAMTFPLLIDLGARQATGAIEVLQLMGSASIMKHVQVPDDMGPLSFQSSKLQRKELPGRGRGLVAKEDIAPGELLITARPLELVRPGDPDWQYQADARLEDGYKVYYIACYSCIMLYLKLFRWHGMLSHALRC